MKRDASLDFLRGLAVIFMVMQHLAVWLWDAGWSKSVSAVKEAPIYYFLIAFSALSAPVFIYAAGIGSSLFMKKYSNNIKIIRRGIIIILFGYISVLTINSWFTYASWYVLQAIGFFFLTVPLLNRMKPKMLIALFFAVGLIAVLGQFYLQTPMAYGNQRMGDTSLALAPLRLALFEGHFPVFPWWGIFILGFYSANFFEKGELHKLIKPALILAFIGITLVASGTLFPNLRAGSITRYIFSYRVSFYPCLFPIYLLLTAASIMSVYLSNRVATVLKITQNNPITAIGRLALTAFFTHIYIKQFVYRYDYVQTLQKWPTIGITAALLTIYAIASLLLRKRGYPFTLEWVLRKLG
jgi:uncharacterized membrane protein